MIKTIKSLFIKKKVLTDDYAELSIGKVGYYAITNGILNNITTQSITFGKAINNNSFLQQMEYAIVDLTIKEIDALSVDDGTKLRKKTQEILLRYGILKNPEPKQKPDVSDEANIFKDFHEADIKWMDQQKTNFEQSGRLH